VIYYGKFRENPQREVGGRRIQTSFLRWVEVVLFVFAFHPPTLLLISFSYFHCLTSFALLLLGYKILHCSILRMIRSKYLLSVEIRYSVQTHFGVVTHNTRLGFIPQRPLRKLTVPLCYNYIFTKPLPCLKKDSQEGRLLKVRKVD
jgi:hypothetical protein